jgi:SsrA-binding protein
MAKKQLPKSNVIVNREARRDYDIIKTYQAGIMLSGAEVKSLRTGHGHLRGAFVNIKDNELWLNNATINATIQNRVSLSESNQTRIRKLLVSKKQLAELTSAKDRGLTIIPLKIHTKMNFIKVDIATAKGLKKYDKRDKIKKRDTNLDAKRELKYK